MQGLQRLRVPRVAALQLRCASNTYSSATSSSVQVCWVDPRAVLDPNYKVREQDVCSVRIPQSMLAWLSQARMELGDADDPLNAWIWGRQAELFEYQLVGSLSTQSGYSSCLTKADLDRLVSNKQSNSAHKSLSWERCQAAIEATGSCEPFLFAGRIMESSRASLYVLKGTGGAIDGIMLSSQAVEDED